MGPDKRDTESSPDKIRDEISPDTAFEIIRYNELHQSAAYIVFGFASTVTTIVAKSSSQPWLQIFQFAPPRWESSQLYLRCADMEPDKKGSEAAMAENTIQVGLPRQVTGRFSPIIE
ncbi:hypothetical protein Tco_0652395 [Tanacetum coccineum]|uniref:Uncharacterized protein n=1 Tax=Tanacetum coccineum TaxID=301880 RepID=A0ABQ4WXG4_9ASTR